MARFVSVIVDLKDKDATLPVRDEVNIGGYVRAALYYQNDGSTDLFKHVEVDKHGVERNRYFIDVPEDEWLDRKVEWFGDLKRSLVCNDWRTYLHTLRRSSKSDDASCNSQSQESDSCLARQDGV